MKRPKPDGRGKPRAYPEVEFQVYQQTAMTSAIDGTPGVLKEPVGEPFKSEVTAALRVHELNLENQTTGVKFFFLMKAKAK